MGPKDSTALRDVVQGRAAEGKASASSVLRKMPKGGNG